MTTYRLIYSDNTLSCLLTDRKTADDFARYMNKEKSVVAIVKISQWN